MSKVLKCLTCGAVIQSKHRHDWVSCDCPTDSSTSIFVDGGDDYFRMGWASTDAQWEEVTDP